MPLSISIRPPSPPYRTQYLSMVALAAVASAPALTRATDEVELKQLVERIARGDPTDSANAADRLVEQVVGPVADAFGALESRPADEQRRLRQVLSRISAALRVRLFRADLTASEVRLLDDFYRQYPDLVNRLFDPSFKVRLDALTSLPLEPDTAAGLLVAAKVDDEDEEVAMAALEVAAELRDGVLARRLVKYVTAVTQGLRDGELGGDDTELTATIVLIAGRACLILADCPEPAARPVVADGLLTFGKSDYRPYIRLPELLDALGKFDDEQSATTLMAFLGERELRYVRAGPQGQSVVQLVGDAALLNLLKLFKLAPESVGFIRAPEAAATEPQPDVRIAPNQRREPGAASPANEPFYGFVDSVGRERAVRAFTEWYENNAKLPAAERRPPTSQPSER